MANVFMVLARGPDSPTGDLNDRLEVAVQLTAQGQLDVSSWETGNTPWLTTRHRQEQPRRDGELVKIESGWAIRGLEHEEDPLLAFSAGLIRPGELATVTRLDGEYLVYRIVAVDNG